MCLTAFQKRNLENVIKESLRRKFLTYKPETSEMPFHYRLLGKDRMALFSFIHSLNTTFGTSIYEPAAIELASNNFKVYLRHQEPYNQITQAAGYTIENIMIDLVGGYRNPDKPIEKTEIAASLQDNNIINVKQTLIDVYLEDFSGNLFLFDIKTVKPNIGAFQGYKRTLLEWFASESIRHPNKNVHTLIAIPFNPYEPKPYQRWTLRGIFDIDEEIMIGKEFWDFLGGDGAYEDLLDCFEIAGQELRPEIDHYFSRFK